MVHMYIDLTNIAEDKEYELEFQAQGDNELFDARNIEFFSPLKLKGTYRLLNDVVQLKANLSFTIKAACDNCLVSVEKEYLIPIQETFHKDSESPEEYGYSGYKVDLRPMIREKILLNLAVKIVCKEDCKGICAVCGSDLNKNECSCKTESKNNPFAILKSIVGGAKNGSTKK